VLLHNGEYTNPHRTDNINRLSPNRTFYIRKEGSYLTINRIGSNPNNYRWEVTDKNGNKSFYGGSPNTILNNSNGISYWALSKQQDPQGNTIEYSYTKTQNDITGIIAQEFYVSKIKYTLRNNQLLNSYYEIDFKRNQYTVADNDQTLNFQQRPDVLSTARFGFLQTTNDLLTEIKINFINNSQSTNIRTYRFDYKNSSFKKSLLEKISEFDTHGNLFYSNVLEYYEPDAANIIDLSVTNWNGDANLFTSFLHDIAPNALLLPNGSALGSSSSKGFSVGLRGGFGIGKDITSVRD
jgi:hypothetical protein